MSQENANEQTYTIGLFGDNYEQLELIGQALGAPDSKSDILVFNRFDQSTNTIFCAMTPLDYPKKLKPFLQVLIFSNIHVLVIDLDSGLNAVIGEILVGLDLFYEHFEKQSCILLANIKETNEWKLPELRKRLSAILNTTSLNVIKTYEIRSKEDLEPFKKHLAELGKKALNSSEEEEQTKILIDHCFPVKGIGTVVLGMIKKGTLHAGEMLEIMGLDDGPKKIIIRSIQKQDRDFKVAHQGDRVGLALKGKISPKEINRDNLIVKPGIYKSEREIKATLFVNQFFKPKDGILKPGAEVQYHAIVETKVSPTKLLAGDEIKPGESGKITLGFEKPLVHDGTGLKGVIMNLNTFQNQSRIIGYFTQIL